MENLKLNQADFKLLTYLYHNNREPLTKIAKACKLSREQVDYKIKKYISSKLIMGFIPIINYTKLGYNCFAMFLFKLEKFSSFNLFCQKLSKNKNCISYGKIYGKYDLFGNFIFKDEKELGDFISELFNSPNRISDYLLIKPFLAELYPLKFCNHKNLEDLPIVGETSDKIKIDERDKKILKCLVQEGRMKLIDIATKLDISIELAFHKLKKLKQNKIIVGSRIQFNMEKLEYYFSQILLDIKNFSDENKNKIRTFCKNSKHINSLTFSLTRPNCMIQLFHKDEGELKETIDSLKKLFENEQIKIELTSTNTEEEKINVLPFFE